MHRLLRPGSQSLRLHYPLGADLRPQHQHPVRLENKFWTILEQLCQAQGRSMGLFLSELYQEALGNGMEMSNFASLLRCSCLVHLETRQEPDVAA
ncbi:ribbon-helix-helix domain-containing protein [Aeromonas hydrophila subsp. hydrophila]|uniref:ribbon-helix-helix domain-containing protein n=1 Tax=Aeromonas hydrophila TaxID=644 RepID=UPI0023EFD542|nr:ribbon-helix-helix domain-containing protein [Aeromonas hydrophila]MDF5704682.1 ribbon-helix-helix domain-containing protein [Aeromonas hydrophila subsp. hydrophila]